MALDYLFEEGILLLVGGVHHAFEEFQDTLAKALADPRFRPGMHLIVDLSASRETKAHPDIWDLAIHLGKLRKQLGSNIAIVLKHAGHCDLVRMLGMYAEQFGFGVYPCLTLEEAKRAVLQPYLSGVID